MRSIVTEFAYATPVLVDIEDESAWTGALHGLPGTTVGHVPDARQPRLSTPAAARGEPAVSILESVHID
jgi:hypothetical protein